jgi:hypothetical protein
LNGEFFVAPLAIKFKTDARGAALLIQNPGPVSHWRIMSYVLAMFAFQNCAPMILVVFVEAGDLLFHRLSSRTYPLLVFLREVGRHHRMIESVTRKQTPEAATSGISSEKWRASAASTVAARIQSCAILIMTNIISRP